MGFFYKEEQVLQAQGFEHLAFKVFYNFLSLP